MTRQPALPEAVAVDAHNASAPANYPSEQNEPNFDLNQMESIDMDRLQGKLVCHYLQFNISVSYLNYITCRQAGPSLGPGQ
jgi:hypothetical protein